MAVIEDKDHVFIGQQDASVPYSLVPRNILYRLVNGRFVKGTISNAISFTEMEVEYAYGNHQRIFASAVTYGEILKRGDVQLVAPLSNTKGDFIIVVISGIIFLVNTLTAKAIDITPIESFLPLTSFDSNLSCIPNDGGTYGVGGYAVICNWPNRPIFIKDTEARISNRFTYEMPTMRLAITAGNRAFGISGNNLLWASDPLGGDSSLAPLTFQEVLAPSTGYTGQIFSIGSGLDAEYVTGMCRMPRFGGPQQDFLAQAFVISTKHHKYIVAGGQPRATWADVQFISYAGNSDGFSGPQAATNIGSSVIYMSTQGRIKSLSQDQERDGNLSETFMDDSLGQYLCSCEPAFNFREWYTTLNHSKAVLKFNRDRLYATVYPFKSPAITKYGEHCQTISHRAVAVASLDPDTQLGAQSSLTWEGFYDWMKPVGMCIIEENLYIVSKDEYGRIRYYRDNLAGVDAAPTSIYTRGYFSDPSLNGRGRTLTRGSLYFKTITGNPEISISYLANDRWICGSKGIARDKLYRFNIELNKVISNDDSIPLKIDIDHKGCQFELKTIYVDGEMLRKD